MKTKLVYVLTCAPEATYIEQALMAIFSTRHWNPNAYIALLVDDKTDALLVGKRAEILDYISEKIVIPFEDASLSPMFRSRWIKTNVRLLVQGDFLFIDSDTITCKDLSVIDNFDCPIGAVWDDQLPLSRNRDEAKRDIDKVTQKLGWSIYDESYYYSSGVIFVKDSPETKAFYKRWFDVWRNGVDKGVSIDQPSLGKTNIEFNHMITAIPDTWNTVIYTQPRLADQAYILHFASFRNPSFLYTKSTLSYIRGHGLTEYIKYWVLCPTYTYIPFDSAVYHYKLIDYVRHYRILVKCISEYAKNIDDTFEDWNIYGGLGEKIYNFLQQGKFKRAALFILLSKFYKVHVSAKYIYKENVMEK